MSRSRKGRRYGSWTEGWKRFVKKFGARKHRQREREAIAHERFEDDALCSLSYQRAEDPWAWD